MDSLGPLPTGWECKIEVKLNRIYFINHTNKSTTWEDPRLASIPAPPYQVAITQPNAYFEETAGSRWSSPVPSLRAFSLHRRGSSPRLGGSPRIAPSPTPPPRNRRNEPLIHFEPSTPNQRRASTSSILHQSTSHTHPQHHVHLLDRLDSQERPPSSYSSSSYNALPTSHLISCDTETAYRTVCSLFPTASDQHIKHLFHKYHNRANLVTSALQVEKYPLACDFGTSNKDISPKNHQDGPHGSSSNRDGDTDTILSIPDTKSIGVSSPFKGNSYATNSPARSGTPISMLKFSNNQSSVGSLLTRSFGSPILSMSPQMQMVRENANNGKPNQKSPKMKLKYMKGIFPAADETILLDVLSSCENNVQRASEKLMRKGFARTPPPKPARQKWLEVKSMIEKRQRALDQQRIVNFQHEIRGEPQESPFPTPIMKTARPHPTVQDKVAAREYLMENFPNLPERFLSWALEASSFSKEKAERLLKEIGPQTPEELKPFISNHQGDQTDFADIAAIIKELEIPKTLNNNVEKERGKGQVKKSSSKEFRIPDPSIETVNPPRKKNFLQTLFSFGKSDKAYITSNKRVKGPNSTLAKGANPSLLHSTYVQALGPNAKVRKGPNPTSASGPQGRAQGANASLARGSFWSRNRHNQVQFVAVEG